MATVTGTGGSRRSDGKKALEEAFAAAAAQLGSAKASFGFLFASPDRDLSELLKHARAIVGTDSLIGCSTAGEFTERGLAHGGVVMLLVSSDDCSTVTAFGQGLKENADGVADQLTSAAAETKKSPGHRYQTTVLLTDGLSGAGERLVQRLCDKGHSGLQVVGGAAGDEGKFATTHVGARDRASADAAAALHVFSASPWGVGVNHGLRPTTKPMKVTKAVDNVVLELDGHPAFKAYVRHASERGVKLSSENASSYMIANELGIHFFDRIVRARAPLSVSDTGALTCAAEIPSGSMVSILDGEPDSMIAAARSAAEEAKANLGGREAAGVLLFDCVCRGMILKDGFHREIDAIASVFGDIPVAGFLTYGEIARYRGKLDGWHNATAVVVAIPK